jgi:hypothetical protein
MRELAAHDHGGAVGGEVGVVDDLAGHGQALDQGPAAGSLPSKRRGLSAPTIAFGSVRLRAGPGAGTAVESRREATRRRFAAGTTVVTVRCRRRVGLAGGRSTAATRLRPGRRRGAYRARGERDSGVARPVPKSRLDVPCGRRDHAFTVGGGDAGTSPVGSGRDGSRRGATSGARPGRDPEMEDDGGPPGRGRGHQSGPSVGSPGQRLGQPRPAAAGARRHRRAQAVPSRYA